MKYLIGCALIALSVYGLRKNLLKFRSESRDKTRFMVYLLDGLIFGTTPLFVLLGCVGAAFLFGLMKIQ